MQYLFDDWGNVAGRLREAKHVLLFSDFDGTLVPIAEKPESVLLSDSIRELLRNLIMQNRFMVGIISGRAIKDLKNRVGVSGLIYAGNHGLEIEGPGVDFIHPLAEEIRPVLHLISQVLNKALKPLKGVFVEDKGLSLSVNYGQAEKTEEKDVKNIFERVIHVARSVGKVRVSAGKKLYEVRPQVAWDKGRALTMLLAKYNKIDDLATLPIFLGDDLTDEDGFKAIHRHRGISILVGDSDPKSAAHYYIHSPMETEQFFRILLNKDMRKR